jgi:hypothetical protein
MDRHVGKWILQNFRTPIWFLSDEERFAPVPEAPVLIYMVKAEKIFRVAEDIRKNIIWKTLMSVSHD